MKLSQWMKASSVLLLGLLVTNTAEARATYVSPLNAALGSSVSCEACHIGGPSGSNASYPIASTYRAGLDLANSDSDSDGYTNKQEASAAMTYFNDPATTPYILQATTAFAGANTKVIADAAAAETAFADTYSLATGAATILGGVKVTLTQPDSVYFKAGGVNASDLVYTVDVSNFGTLVPASDWSAAANGALNILALPAGNLGSADYVVVHTALAVSSGAQPTGEDEGFECLIAGMPSTLAMMFAMLGLGFFARRK
ncbi:MAG: hypothetical protein AUK35_06655 [Zetaproteobacteria bacterium CG2_30_46_52]|nr:MAG: hypothetical protein AUK35_06655 [Zetaproteobacteria bacterium CG2_30_46_52]